MMKFMGAFALFFLSLMVLLIMINQKPSVPSNNISASEISSAELNDDVDIEMPAPADQGNWLIISPDEKYRVFRNDTRYSMQIIDVVANKVVFELKDKINTSKETDDPHSGNVSYYPVSWSPDSDSLIYEAVGYEISSFDLISKINNKFTNSVKWLNDLSPDSNGPSLCGNPIWSPDSKKMIIVENNRNSCNGELYIIDPTQGITAKYLETNLYYVSIDDAKWSNDSKSLIVTKNYYNHEDGDYSKIASSENKLVVVEK